MIQGQHAVKLKINSQIEIQVIRLTNERLQVSFFYDGILLGEVLIGSIH